MRHDAMRLVYGLAPWMEIAHRVIAGVAAIALMTSTITTAVKILFLLLLAAWLVFFYMRPVTVSSGQLCRDTNGHWRDSGLHTRQVLKIDQRHWLSRWFCVVNFYDPGTRKTRRLVVCAALNSSSVYRRLVVLLRVQSAAS